MRLVAPLVAQVVGRDLLDQGVAAPQQGLIDRMRHRRQHLPAVQFMAQIDLVGPPVDRLGDAGRVPGMALSAVLAQQCQCHRQADGDEIDQVAGEAFRPVVVLRTGPPFDEPGPAMQARQFVGEVVDPLLFGHAELLEDIGDDALGLFVLFEDAADMQAVEVEGHVAIGHVAPCGEQAVLASRHVPHRLALVEEVQAALDHQLIEFATDLGAIQCIDGLVQRAIAEQPVMQVLPQRLCGRVFPRQFATVQRGVHVGGRGQRAWPHHRLADPGHQDRQPVLQIDPRDGVARLDEAPDRIGQRRPVDLSGSQVPLVDVARQKRAPVEQRGALVGGLLEGQVLEAVQRVVVDEGPHRPEERDWLRGDMDHRADLEA